MRKDSADIDFGGSSLENGCSEFLFRRKALITNVNLFSWRWLNRHGKLATREELRTAVTEPGMQHAKGKETRVVHLQELWTVNNRRVFARRGLFVDVDILVILFGVAIVNLHPLGCRRGSGHGCAVVVSL